MDCSIVPVKKGLFLISTTDYFYPLVEDPYIQGKIGCANVLSDLYAMGIDTCDNMLMILAASRDMPERERLICTQEMIRGFNDLAAEAETTITGGQTVMNPWPIIGGTAMSVLSEGEFIRPDKLEEGDLVVLTKPIGTQVAVNLHQWKELKSANWFKVENMVTTEEIHEAFSKAMKQMSRLNRNGARLMHKYGAHGATDVTGFGLIGHASNLARNQSIPLNIEIHSLPIIKDMRRIDEHVKIFKLMNGLSAETSGGLLVCLPADKAEDFVREIQELDNAPAWIIGKVVRNDTKEKNCAIIVDNPTVIEV